MKVFNGIDSHYSYQNFNKGKVEESPSYRVAVVEWEARGHGIAEVIRDELKNLGHVPSEIHTDEVIPGDIDVVFSFGPYGNFVQLSRQMSKCLPTDRPTFVHWNTEGLPDLRIPWPVIRTVGSIRSWIGRVGYSENNHKVRLFNRLFDFYGMRMLRYKYVGDYYYYYQNGLLNVFADTSEIYARIHEANGLPTVVAPWGSTARWFSDLGLERDIDVLWMGKRGSRRRSSLLDRVIKELDALGLRLFIADNVENPYIFDSTRTHYLNRSKIILNITRTWYDDNFSRLALAAPNRSLVVSEPLLPHCADFEAGVHYVSAQVEKLVESIIYYVEREEERVRITENAYQLVTNKLAFKNSIERIMDAVHQHRCQGGKF